jgi:hypothetical protein
MGQVRLATPGLHSELTVVPPQLRDCIQTCMRCEDACLRTVATCLRLGGRYLAQEHVGLLLECMQHCSTSADFMTRGSPTYVLTCQQCANICFLCAESCRRLGGTEMQACADVCETCADSCSRTARPEKRSLTL